MSQIIKAYLGVFLMMSLISISLGMLSLFFTAGQAQRTCSEIQCEIENSHFDQQVIQACRNRAEDRGYRLQVKLYQENMPEQSQADPEADVTLARIELHCPLTLPILNIHQDYILTAYAR